MSNGPIAGMPRITPSKMGPNYWQGTKVRGDVFTLEQRRTMRVREPGRQLKTFAVCFMVDGKRPGDPRVELRFNCPLVAETPTGRKVITPSGQMVWVDKKGGNA